MDYYFDGHLRQAFGFDSPNYAGLFFGCLIAVLYRASFAIRRWRSVFLGGLALEALCWWALVSTYSRGALVAVLGGCGYAAVLLYAREVPWGVWSAPAAKSYVAAGLFPRLLLLGAMLVSTGFIGRVSPSYLAEDGSALNRVELWRGGAKMIADSPWLGWGGGDGGKHFTLWYRGDGLEHEYLTFVNSYITLGVEYGALALLGVLGLTSYLLLAPLFRVGERDESEGLATVAADAAACGFLVIAIGNVFSVLLGSLSLNALLGAFLLALIADAVRMDAGRALRFGLAAALSLTGVGSLLVVGQFDGREAMEREVAYGGRAVVLRAGTGGTRMLVVAGSGRLAEAVEHARAAVAGLDGPFEIAFVTRSEDGFAFLAGEFFDASIAFGDAWSALDEVNVGRRVLILPSGASPEADDIELDALCVEAADRHGENGYWVARAERFGVEAQVIAAGAAYRAVRRELERR